MDTKNGHRIYTWALGLVGVAIILTGLTFPAYGEQDLPMAVALLLVGVMFTLTMLAGVLWAGLRENAERVKREVEGR